MALEQVGEVPQLRECKRDAIEGWEAQMAQCVCRMLQWGFLRGCVIARVLPRSLPRPLPRLYPLALAAAVVLILALSLTWPKSVCEIHGGQRSTL